MPVVPSGEPGATVHDPDHRRLERACAELEAPFACVDLDAFDANREALARRAGGTRIRLASKSIRCRALLERVLGGEDSAVQGMLVLTVREALWLSEHGFNDIVVGYPSVDRRALAELVRRSQSVSPEHRIAVMVDAVEHLDLLEAAGAAAGSEVNVCLDADAGLWLFGGRVRVGPKRSPLHTPLQLMALSQEVRRRPGLRLAGMMAYEGQIAGVGDRPPGQPLRALAIRAMQSASRRELRERRAELVAAVKPAGHEAFFVNAGGTGCCQQVEVFDRVDHHRDAVLRCDALRASHELRQGLAIDTRVADDDVPHAVVGEPQRLGDGQREHAMEGAALIGEQPLEQRTAAQRLAGDADRLAAGAARERVGVLGEGVDVDHGERRLEFRAGAFEPFMVAGTDHLSRKANGHTLALEHGYGERAIPWGRFWLAQLGRAPELLPQRT